MGVNNLPKLIGLLLAMVIIGALMALHVLQEATGTPLLTLIVGYLVGNGVAAIKGDNVEPIIGKRKVKENG